MRLARYVGDGCVAIVDEPAPTLPPGGLLVRTLASGLCSGELMSWYMDQKIPHVLGHEVCGRVEESDDARFPVGCLVAPHHHAPCMTCEACRKGRHVHCAQWKRTKLNPGGMSERFAVAAENLTDTHRVDDLRPIDAALIEPLGCVMKSIARGRLLEAERVGVLGLGSMGLMHLAILGERSVGFDPNPARRDFAVRQGYGVGDPGAASEFDAIVVCPGAPAAALEGLGKLAPGGVLVLFAPLGPGQSLDLDWNRFYFQDFTIVASYSCGPDDTAAAAQALRAGTLRAENVVSDFITLDQLPEAYQAMKRGDIVKAMVAFA